MARPHRRALALVAAAFVAAAAADAQTLPRLKVTALGMHPDRAFVAPHEPFHVTIRVHVDRRRERLDELVLGTLENCSIIGDERRPPVYGNGTEFTEILTLEANAPGKAVISPAYVDAVDPASGRGLRYSSNAVSIRVSGAGSPADGPFHAFTRFARLALVGAGVAAAAFVLAVLFVLRRKRGVALGPAPAVAPVVAAAQPTARERLLAAADAFARDPTETRLAAIRALLFEIAGVPAGATLVDLLRRVDHGERALRGAAVAAERAMFGPHAERAGARADVLAAIEAYCGRRTANEGAWTR